MQYLAAAVVIMTVACSACKGRYADATPNGETVEMEVVEPVVVNPGDSAGVNATAEPGSPVVTKVVTISDVKAKE